MKLTEVQIMVESLDELKAENKVHGFLTEIQREAFGERIIKNFRIKEVVEEGTFYNVVVDVNVLSVGDVKKYFTDKVQNIFDNYEVDEGISGIK